MEEDLKEGCVVAIMMALHDAYYGHHDEELLEKVIRTNLEFFINGIRQQDVPEPEGPEETISGSEEVV